MRFLNRVASRLRGSRPGDEPFSDARAEAARRVPGSLSRPPQAVPGSPRFAVLDIETTALSPETGRILEIAVVSTDPYGRTIDEWSTKINPQGSVGATHIHGIKPEDVASAPVFHDVIADISRRLAGAALVAHNARFELAFLRAEYERAGWSLPEVPHLCTLEASLVHLPQLGRRRLADCCWAVGTPLTGAHTALGDARATAVVLAAFMHPNWGLPPLSHHVELPEMALSVRWPSGPTRDPAALSVAPPEGFRWAAAPPSNTALVSLLDRFSLTDTLDDSASPGAVSYLETLAESLEDGQLTDQEAADLAVLSHAVGLDDDEVDHLNLSFVLALAHQAMKDGVVSRAERSELASVAALLKIDPKVVPALVERAEIARERHLGADLQPLPEGWAHGEPLRVGDRIVFTGCEAFNRQGMERRATASGLRVIGSVSAKVALLVSDGTVSGGKAADAKFLGTRVVHPEEFEVLLNHVQPALPREARPLPRSRAPKGTRDNSKQQSGGNNQSPAKAAALVLPEGVTPADVRQWGRENGWGVGSRGRLNPKLVAAYITANRS